MARYRKTEDGWEKTSGGVSKAELDEIKNEVLDAKQDLTQISNEAFVIKGNTINADLNDVKKAGSYVCSNGASNRPENTWGTLLVFEGGTGSVTQIYTTALGINYIRHFDGGNWTGWIVTGIVDYSSGKQIRLAVSGNILYVRTSDGHTYSAQLNQLN